LRAATIQKHSRGPLLGQFELDIVLCIFGAAKLDNH
jgi:hypothetical protein